jgi:branched-chain amino acid transport system permease protein
MVMLIRDGAGWLYAAFISAVVYMVLENRLSAVSPKFWQFGLGAVLVTVALLVQRRRVDWAGVVRQMVVWEGRR